MKKKTLLQNLIKNQNKFLIILLLANFLWTFSSYANLKTYSLDNELWKLDSSINPNLKSKVAFTRFDSLSILKMQQPDWELSLLPGDLYDLLTFTSGDLNGDGYIDLIINIQRNNEVRTELLYVYYSSENGIKKMPDEVIILNDPMKFEYMVVTSLDCVGDINGDGYEDIVVNYYYNNMGHTIQNPLLFYGSRNGLSNTPLKVMGTNNPKSNIKGIGDVNGDNFDDFLVINDAPQKSGIIYYGSPDGPVQFQNWPAEVYSQEGIEDYMHVFPGDFNNDGFNDLAIYGQNLFVFYGSESGLSNIHQQQISLLGGKYSMLSPFIISGDYNGDKFSDLIIMSYLRELEPGGYDTRRVLFLVPGSENFLDTINYLIINDWNSDFYYTSSLSHLGDINNDGFDDFDLSSIIHFGGIYSRRSNPPFKFNQMHFNVDGSNFSNNYGIKGIGDLNNDGSSDFYSLYQGFKIYYSPSFDPIELKCPELIQECYSEEKDYYSIPLVEISNSHFTSIQYTVHESENPFKVIRTGHGLDASGKFFKDSKIIYYAQAYNNVNYYCTTAFEFKHLPITPVTIKPGYSHPKAEPNTFYIGYGASSFRIEALPAGGGGPYSYLWSNGSTEKNPRISETVPGEYPYWVRMTNANGCTSSDSVIIKVENALCSSPLVDAVLNEYPMILQNTLLANLIKSNSKIAVCKDGQTLCFTKSVVDIRIERPGYTIGACTPGVIPAEAFMTDEIEEILQGKLKVLVAPNPSNNNFQLNVVSIYNAPVQIRIIDITGRQVELIRNAAVNSSITVGNKLQAGIYMAEITSGQDRIVTKLIKIQ